MPLYDYSCEKCGKRFELIRNISDVSDVKCPDCNSTCRKNITATSFQLKGSGWYKTDYKSHGPACGCCNKASDGTCGV